MSNKFPTIQPQTLIGGISTIFSTVGIFVLYAYHIITAYSIIIIPICCFIIIGSYFVKWKWLKWVRISVGCILALSLIAGLFTWIEFSRGERDVLISDATASLLDAFNEDPEDEWINQSMENGKLVFFLLSTKENPKQFLYQECKKYYSTHVTPLSTFDVNYNFMTLTVTQKERTLQCKHTLGMTDLDVLRSISPSNKHCILLPASTLETVLGHISLRNYDFQAAKKHFEIADSLGNATGTYLLSKWYETGFNCDPKDEHVRARAMQLLNKAAKKGSREARVKWSKNVLNNPASTDFERGKAEDFLRRASMLNTTATYRTAETTHEALKTLNNYYRTTGRFRKAYQTTRKSYKLFQDQSVRFCDHLDNCLSLGLYREARSLIEEGERLQYKYCHLIHAGMLMNGQGFNQDYNKAEQILRFVADSLNYAAAYKGLAELYEKTDRNGVDFWEGLYNVQFDNRIEE